MEPFDQFELNQVDREPGLHVYVQFDGYFPPNNREVYLEQSNVNVLQLILQFFMHDPILPVIEEFMSC